MGSRKWILVGILLAGVFALHSLLAPSANAIMYYACKNNSDGTVYMVAADTTCRNNYTKISWNDVGPKGDTGAQGPQGEIGPAGPAGPAGPGAASYTFKGFSSEACTGDCGLFSMNAICDETYPGSRMCSSGEIKGALLPPGEGWVHPEFLSPTAMYNPFSTETYIFLYEMNLGIVVFARGGSGPLSCDGWSATHQGTSGLAVLGIGTKYSRFIQRPCTMEYKVACCGPAN